MPVLTLPEMDIDDVLSNYDSALKRAVANSYSIFYDQKKVAAVTSTGQQVLRMYQQGLIAMSTAADAVTKAYVDQQFANGNLFLPRMRRHFTLESKFETYPDKPVQHKGYWIAPRGSFYDCALNADLTEDVMQLEASGRYLFALKVKPFDYLPDDVNKAWDWLTANIGVRHLRFGRINEYEFPSFEDCDQLLVEIYDKKDATLFKLMFS